MCNGNSFMFCIKFSPFYTVLLFSDSPTTTASKRITDDMHDYVTVDEYFEHNHAPKCRQFRSRQNCNIITIPLVFPVTLHDHAVAIYSM